MLRLLLKKYLLEIPLLVFYKDCFGIRLLTKVDMLCKKETETEIFENIWYDLTNKFKVLFLVIVIQFIV